MKAATKPTNAPERVSGNDGRALRQSTAPNAANPAAAMGQRASIRLHRPSVLPDESSAIPMTITNTPPRWYHSGLSPRKMMARKVANSGELPLMGAALATPIFEMPYMKQMENSPGLTTPATASQR